VKIGWVGLGKLGLPCALVIDRCDHTVRAVDPRGPVQDAITSRETDSEEPDVALLLREHSIEMVEADALAAWADLIFVAVQTPHDPEFEGITRLPEERRDFDYSYLQQAMQDVGRGYERTDRRPPLVVVSTVLPGTTRRLAASCLPDGVAIGYNPSTIAMGTVVADFRSPEFVLVGADDQATVDQLRDFYASIHDRDVAPMSIESAELTKLAYNTFLTMKIAFANTMAEVASKVGADASVVMSALTRAGKRLISSTYLEPGMGDGGGCHPRDNIAMSWLAREKELGFDLFEAMMLAREAHTNWIADETERAAAASGLPIVILGKTYKADVKIVTGSPALLLKSMLPTAEQWDPLMDEPRDFESPRVFVVATNHAVFSTMRYPSGSVVIDPWGVVPDQTEVCVCRLGRDSTG
jgi:UDPglucose 6-dehydrogenase